MFVSSAVTSSGTSRVISYGRQSHRGMTVIFSPIFVVRKNDGGGRDATAVIRYRGYAIYRRAGDFSSERNDCLLVVGGVFCWRHGCHRSPAQRYSTGTLYTLRTELSPWDLIEFFFTAALVDHRPITITHVAAAATTCE